MIVGSHILPAVTIQVSVATIHSWTPASLGTSHRAPDIDRPDPTPDCQPIDGRCRRRSKPCGSSSALSLLSRGNPYQISIPRRNSGAQSRSDLPNHWESEIEPHVLAGGVSIAPGAPFETRIPSRCFIHEWLSASIDRAGFDSSVSPRQNLGMGYSVRVQPINALSQIVIR